MLYSSAIFFSILSIRNEHQLLYFLQLIFPLPLFPSFFHDVLHHMNPLPLLCLVMESWNPPPPLCCTTSFIDGLLSLLRFTWSSIYLDYDYLYIYIHLCIWVVNRLCSRCTTLCKLGLFSVVVRPANSSEFFPDCL